MSQNCRSCDISEPQLPVIENKFQKAEKFYLSSVFSVLVTPAKLMAAVSSVAASTKSDLLFLPKNGQSIQNTTSKIKKSL